MQRSSLRRVGALTFGVSMVVMAAGTVGRVLGSDRTSRYRSSGLGADRFRAGPRVRLRPERRHRRCARRVRRHDPRR